jgi:asparagine N-glycosylation enzyme membrane subunit Stt3
MTPESRMHAVWKRASLPLRARARLRRQHRARIRTQRLKYVTPEQLAYADVLEIGLTIGRYFLLGTFILYVFGVTAPKVPLSDLPSHWSLPSDQYSRVIGVGSGWDWLNVAHYGDYMNFIGIAFFSSVTIFCYLRLLPISLRSKDYLFMAIILLEMLVLLLAASGLLAFGH